MLAGKRSMDTCKLCYEEFHLAVNITVNPLILTLLTTLLKS